MVKKTTEATGDLIGNKIADKITSACKSKKDTAKTQQNNKMNEEQKIYIPSEKRQQVRFYKNGIPKNHKPDRYNI